MSERRHFSSRGMRIVLAALATGMALPFLGAATLRDAGWQLLARHWHHHRPAAVVFCGDSNTAQVEPWVRSRTFGVANSHNLAVSGARITDMARQLSEASRLASAAIVLMAGTNDLAQRDEIILQQMSAVMTLARRTVGQRLLVVSIPLQRNRSRDARIQALNDGIRALAVRHQWQFLDANASVFVAGQDRSERLEDDVHFNAQARAEWLAAVARALAPA